MFLKMKILHSAVMLWSTGMTATRCFLCLTFVFWLWSQKIAQSKTSKWLDVTKGCTENGIFPPYCGKLCSVKVRSGCQLTVTFLYYLFTLGLYNMPWHTLKWFKCWNIHRTCSNRLLYLIQMQFHDKSCSVEQPPPLVHKEIASTA